jgi:diguanylate cyclase (GGDEF)-like protein
VVPPRKRRDAGILIAAGAALLISLGGVAALIVRSQDESRQHLRANLALRAGASAQLVGTYLAQQQERQRRSGALFLSGDRVSRQRFAAVAGAFGANFAVLLDEKGTALLSAPYNPAIVGRDVGYESRAGREAIEGRTTVSGVLPVPGQTGRIVGVLVPFLTPHGERVFGAAYPVAGGELQALVDRTSTVPGHEVYLTDGEGNLIAASPHSDRGVLADADPQLSSTLQQAPAAGSLRERSAARTYAAAAVPGTRWQLVIDVPDAGLYASVSGLADVVPWLAFALLSLLAGLLMVLVTRVLRDRARLGELSDELADRARTDTLTGLLNRRGIDEGLVRISGRSRRREEPLTILMIDLDRFKQVNDKHGHEAGDLVLKAFADCMREALRTEDLYGRFGGDEFIVALTDRDADAGAAAAERLRAAAGAADLSTIGLEGGVALSIGVASGLHTTVAELIRAADEDLYRDKAGRRAAAASAQSTGVPR